MESSRSRIENYVQTNSRLTGDAADPGGNSNHRGNTIPLVIVRANATTRSCARSYSRRLSEVTVSIATETASSAASANNQKVQPVPASLLHMAGVKVNAGRIESGTSRFVEVNTLSRRR